MTNDYENLDEEENIPSQDFATITEQPVSQEDLISNGNPGIVYDWQNAPDVVKAPPREDLNGKTVTINSAEIVLPSPSKPWDKTRDKSKDVKACTFVLHYDINGQQEFYSGVRVFKREDGKYSYPTFAKDRKCQASALMGAYADFKNKNINEVSFKEFMAFLNSKPKGLIESKEFENPVTGEKITKNIIVKFLG